MDKETLRYFAYGCLLGLGLLLAGLAVLGCGDNTVPPSVDAAVSFEADAAGISPDDVGEPTGDTPDATPDAPPDAPALPDAASSEWVCSRHGQDNLGCCVSACQKTCPDARFPECRDGCAAKCRELLDD